ncbi:LPS export ABC transporter periplasmic protein LptC [Rubrimonas cliftonensis]|uniref:LPS export ABC transporter periplasmic protein LptC n=1 Tax=Rubrimonas cliftonensis TaxID=89524 RepID=UPI001114D2A0|nr:LPS export ABC transporter periplasmic protein LptC [Rubrimonas cliftonensis]
MTRSGVVRVLKIALPLGALALVAALFFATGRDRGEGLGMSGVTFSATDGLRLTSPRFTGRTDAGAPFEVRAEWALPDGPDPSVIELGPVVGGISLDGHGEGHGDGEGAAGGRRLTLSADGGELRPKEERLSLSGGVTARTSDGYILTVTRAEADLAAGTMRAEGPVRGSGPAGTIEAQALEASRRDGAGHVRFSGGVRVRIDPQAARGEADR